MGGGGGKKKLVSTVNAFMIGTVFNICSLNDLLKILLQCHLLFGEDIIDFLYRNELIIIAERTVK